MGPLGPVLPCQIQKSTMNSTKCVELLSVCSFYSNQGVCGCPGFTFGPIGPALPMGPGWPFGPGGPEDPVCPLFPCLNKIDGDIR